jgi:hypothetical protein
MEFAGDTHFAPEVHQERRPVSAAQLTAAGVDLARDFPGSTIDDFREYPVLSEGGWFTVIKHQPSLRTVSRKPWRLLGPVTLLTEGLEFD